MGLPRRRKFLNILNLSFIIVILLLILDLHHLSQAISVHIDESKSYLKSYQPVFYNTTDLLDQHRRAKREVGESKDEQIKLQFFSHNRNFELKLGINDNLFHPDVIFENSDGPIQYNTRKALTGTIKDDENSVAHGILTSDGVFDGYLSTQDGEYYMEPKTTEKQSPSIMYRPEDVEWHSNTNNKNEPSACASHELHLSVKEEGSKEKSKAEAQLSRTKTVASNPVAHNSSNVEKSRQRRSKSWAVDPKKKTCMLYLQADHLFYERFGSEEACIDIMTKHIQRVNDIYKSTDFDQDGRPDDITFMIKRVKVHTANHTKDPAYRYKGEFQVIKFLEIFSEGDYDSFCLAYMFTFRDFEGGTLGLAWTGDLKNAGGVCEKKGHFRGGLKSLNTGIITLLNYGKVVPPSVSYVTLAHEIGHNFGSPHDPEADKTCVPSGDDGNFIMFARATAGDRKNNNKFSPCSLRSILPVLNSKARDLHGCFTEPQESICGNGVVEKGEQCDCGWEEDCKEDCCFPMQLRPKMSEPPCRLRPNKQCSPSQGPCCTLECTTKLGDKCREDNGCRDASFCDGLQPFCPMSVSKPNKTVCNKESVCFMGECTGSICLAYGLESCQCSPESWESSSKLCELCCKLPGEGMPCLSSKTWNEPPFDVPDMNAKPGSPCKNYTGYCDAYQTCREIDPSGPLATLRKLLLADEGLAFIAEWIDNHWYAVLSFVILLVVLMIATAKICGKRAKARLRKLTIMHSNVEAIQIQRTYLDDADTGVTHHPVAVRKKIPFRKKVRERRKSKRERIRRPKEKNLEPSSSSRMPTMKLGGSLWKKKHSGVKSVSASTAAAAAQKNKRPATAKTEESHNSSSTTRNAPSNVVLPASSSTKIVAETTDLSKMTPMASLSPTNNNNNNSNSHATAPTSTTSNGVPPQIIHEVNTAIVPHANQKRKQRKSHEGNGHRKSREKTNSSKNGVRKKRPENHSQSLAAIPTSSSSSSQSPVKKSSDSQAKNHSETKEKKNIQVVYRAPFSINVQVVSGGSKEAKQKKKQQDQKQSDKSDGEKVRSKTTANNTGASTTTGGGGGNGEGKMTKKSIIAAPSSSSNNKPKPTSSFLQRRQKSKNPSQSELKLLLIAPGDDAGDLQSPVTPIT